MASAVDVLRRRVQALLEHNEIDRKELATYVGHRPSWLSDFLNGRSGITLKDLDRIARFFGVSVPQLFEIDGTRFRERRRGERRAGTDRRSGRDRRKTPW